MEKSNLLYILVDDNIVSDILRKLQDQQTNKLVLFFILWHDFHRWQFSTAGERTSENYGTIIIIFLSNAVGTSYALIDAWLAISAYSSCLRSNRKWRSQDNSHTINSSSTALWRFSFGLHASIHYLNVHRLVLGAWPSQMPPPRTLSPSTFLRRLRISTAIKWDKSQSPPTDGEHGFTERRVHRPRRSPPITHPRECPLRCGGQTRPRRCNRIKTADRWWRMEGEGRRRGNWLRKSPYRRGAPGRREDVNPPFTYFSFYVSLPTAVQSVTRRWQHVQLEIDDGSR